MHKDEIEILIIEDFYSKKLQNCRNIRVYLPPSYNSSNKFYPVLYTHDGQNVFNAEESYSGKSWRLQYTTDYLIRNDLIEEIIIVAVDNMEEERLSEYAVENGSYRGKKIKAKGLIYEEFFTEELMPLINNKFRTKKEAQDTALMGSSMGGLATFNIGLRRPELFGKLAVMSPSFWWGKSSPLEKINSYDYNNLNTKFWFDTGDAEGKFQSFPDEVIDRLIEIKNKNSLDLFYYLAEGAVHSESAWAARVHCPLLFFFGSIGTAEKIELMGENSVKIGGAEVKINPVLSFDSGFKITVLEGKFKSSNNDLLEIDKRGNIFAKKPGEAEINFKALGFKTSKKIKVIK